MTKITAACTATAISRIRRSCVSTPPATQPPPWKNMTAGMTRSRCFSGEQCVLGPRPSDPLGAPGPRCSRWVFLSALTAGSRVGSERRRAISARVGTAPEAVSCSTKCPVAGSRFADGNLSVGHSRPASCLCRGWTAFPERPGTSIRMLPEGTGRMGVVLENWSSRPIVVNNYEVFAQRTECHSLSILVKRNRSWAMKLLRTAPP